MAGEEGSHRRPLSQPDKVSQIVQAWETPWLERSNWLLGRCRLARQTRS